VARFLHLVMSNRKYQEGLRIMDKNLNYTTLARQTALRRNLNMIANNLANINTTGFKRSSLFLVGDNVKQSSGEMITMPLDYSTFRDLSQGALVQTGDPYDVGILGRGHFMIARSDQTYYTRDGHFTQNEKGELCTHQGDLVQSAGGGPIMIPPTALSFVIHPDGTVATEDEVVGKIAVVTFEDEQELKEWQDNLFTTTAEAIGATDYKLRQHHVESSNINPAVAMTDMIAVQREFEINQKILDSAGDLLGSFIQNIL
jgi:flagellar basal-body rod protein FlgF